MAKIEAYPFKFKTILKSPIWGTEEWIVSTVPGFESIITNGALAGKTLSEVIAMNPEETLGEEVTKRYGEKFPLLIKYIKAESDLSIQVHPNDELAQKRHNCSGKNEMWMILGAREDARLLLGFNQKISKYEYFERVKCNTLTDVLNNYKVTIGDVYYIPAGRIHAIGGGCFLLEVQQSSDITYRIYDYNRKDTSGNLRDLHTDLAVDAIDYAIVDNPKDKYGAINDGDIINCDYFKVREIKITESSPYNIKTMARFLILVCVGGEGIIQWGNKEKSKMNMAQYDCIFLPASLDKVIINGNIICIAVGI